MLRPSSNWLKALKHSQPATERLVVVLAAGAVFLCYTTSLAPGLSWANNGADGGDLITAAATLGVAHPSGYPTYLLLAHLFQWLPIGTLALRTNLFSAVCASLAAALVVPIVARTHSGSRRYCLAGGLVSGIAFGLSPLLWSQAVISEVHALQALFVAAIFYTMPLGAKGQRTGSGHFLAGVVVGLALGNHLTTALLLPPWLILSAWDDGRFRPSRLGWRMAGMAAGLLVYAYLPLRASTHPAVNWGDPSSLSGIVWVVSGGSYRALAFGLPGNFVGARLGGWASLLIAQFGLLGMAAAFYGLFFASTTGRRVKLVTGWLAAAASVFAIGYNTADLYAYLLPAFLALAIWLGLGLATALASLHQKKWPFAAQVAVCGGLMLTIVFNAVLELPSVDASRDRAAEQFGELVMNVAPPGALLFTHADRDTFATWYFHFALGRRPDLAVIAEPLLIFDWYRTNLQATYPDLVMPNQPSGGWREALAGLNPRPICDTQPDQPGPLKCAGQRP